MLFGHPMILVKSTHKVTSHSPGWLGRPLKAKPKEAKHQQRATVSPKPSRPWPFATSPSIASDAETTRKKSSWDSLSMERFGLPRWWMKSPPFLEGTKHWGIHRGNTRSRYVGFILHILIPMRRVCIILTTFHTYHTYFPPGYCWVNSGPPPRDVEHHTSAKHGHRSLKKKTWNATDMLLPVFEAQAVEMEDKRDCFSACLSFYLMSTYRVSGISVPHLPPSQQNQPGIGTINLLLPESHQKVSQMDLLGKLKQTSFRPARPS